MVKFEEYKLHAERAQKLSERRQTTTQTYLTINTAIFGAVAFIVKDSGLENWGLFGIVLPLFIFGIIACMIWKSLLENIHRFLDYQYEQLRLMEASFPEESRLFTREYEKFYAGDNRKFSFSSLEARLPVMLAIVYSTYAVGILIITIL